MPKSEGVLTTWRVNRCGDDDDDDDDVVLNEEARARNV